MRRGDQNQKRDRRGVNARLSHVHESESATSFASQPPTPKEKTFQKRGAAGGPRRNPRARGSSRLSGSPLEPLTGGMTKTSNQLKTHKIEMFCGNTKKIERSRLVRMCTCTIEQDEVFKLPTAANFHCEKKVQVFVF